MSSEPFFLDVNVPMYAAGRDHPLAEPCAEVLRRVAEGDLEAVIDTEIVQEILYRYGHLRQWATGAAMADSLLEIVPAVLPVMPSDARRAVALFERYGPQGVTARDVLHAAVMMNNDLTDIISADRRFDRIEGIRRWDPTEIIEVR